MARDGCCSKTEHQGGSILEEAHGIITGDRLAKYGHPLDNWSDIVAKWNVTLRRKLKEPLTPEEAQLCMIDVKTCREANIHHPDNLRDIAGYAGTTAMTIDERKRRGGIDAEKTLV